MPIYHRVRNVDHLGSDISILDDLPELNYTFNISDVGTADWYVPLDHPNLGREDFAPKRTDYYIELSSNNVDWVPVQGGICGPTNLKSGQQGVKVSGSDWLSYLKQPYFFDYDTSLVNLDDLKASDVAVWWVNESQQQIITDILAGMYDGTGNTIQFTPQFISSPYWSEVLVYIILRGDTTDALAHIQAVGSFIEPHGFEFICEPDKTVKFYAPRYKIADATPLVTFTPSNTVGLLEIDWTNTGPKGTQTVGMPPGFPALQAFSEYTPSTAVFRKWLNLVQLRDTIYTHEETLQATYAIGNRDRAPQKELTLSIKPDEYGTGDHSALFFNKCGEVIEIDSEDYFLPYWRIQAYFWINQQSFRKDDAGNWVCDLSLEQTFHNE